VTGQAVQMLESWSFGMRWVWCLLELHQSAFSSILKCIDQYGYKMKPYRLRHHGTDTRIGQWHTFIGRRRHLCPAWPWHRWQWHIHHTVVWQYKLLTYCTSCPQVYGGSQLVTMNESPSINIVAHWVFSCSSFLKSYSCWWLRHILSLVLGHIGQKTVLTAWRDCSGNVFVSGNYCADGARSEGHAEI
jgi:hypothetical protein